ncbi:hypothetical protein WJX72_001154 [[Myrmecia] bisecta]|uniref:Pathogen-related protein n=1 Tax=[Myrmecia] bisecta TaxID=41462 RepID=A0AAW1PXR0_9CHLO
MGFFSKKPDRSKPDLNALSSTLKATSLTASSPKKPAAAGASEGKCPVVHNEGKCPVAHKVHAEASSASNKAAAPNVAAPPVSSAQSSEAPAKVEQPSEAPAKAEQPAVPNYMLDPNAVLKDKDVAWRLGHAPSYDIANNKFAKERQHPHKAGSLEEMVSNLVKNWEKEASHKMKGEQWRTVDVTSYTFSCNGGQKFSSAEMIEMGTYNALIGEHAYYSSAATTFEDSHHCFRNALPTGFAWEVTDVYSGPPKACFKWRHWGLMSGKLVCPLGHGRTLEADPTNRDIELFGICVAELNDKFKITSIEVFYDPHQLLGSMVQDFSPLATVGELTEEEPA